MSYVRVDPKVEYIVHDEHDVIVAVCAHQGMAKALHDKFGYGWYSDSSRFVGSHRVGQDVNLLLDATERKDCGLTPKNNHAVR